MGKIIGILGGLCIYFCIATVISLVVLLAYASSQGFLDKDKINKMVAVAQGAELAPIGGDEAETTETKLTAEKAKPNEPVEQLSLEEIEAHRNVHIRNLELREQALDSGLQQIRAEQQKLADDKESYDRLKSAFDNQLKELNDGSQATGRENIRLIWENIKPKQAKDQILQMIQAGQQNDVVAIMSAMPIAKRAKIIGEFKTGEETKKLQDILDLIRRGMPKQQVIENTQQQVTQNKP
ncbi:MAG TPA: hypothetical protein VGI75_07070 [Pirellulales bacterium]